MIGTRILIGTDIGDVLDDLARLRITVFRDWPYLYEGDVDYERGYLERYATASAGTVVVAEDKGAIVGAATGMALSASDEDFSAAFEGSGLDLDEVYYCAESVLLPQYRGRGLGHAFFDGREAIARANGFKFSAFCAVERAADHPLRPAEYRPLDPFWRRRGYTPLAGVQARFSWKDVGDAHPTEKALNFWIKEL